MEVLTEYFNLQKKIYEYFGYEEDWKIIPVSDCREYYWCISHEGTVKFANNKLNIFKFHEEDGYEELIYKSSFLPKCVYIGKDFTMIIIDTRTDGNKFLSIFDNAKEVKED